MPLNGKHIARMDWNNITIYYSMWVVVWEILHSLENILTIVRFLYVTNYEDIKKVMMMLDVR